MLVSRSSCHAHAAHIAHRPPHLRIVHPESEAPPMRPPTNPAELARTIAAGQLDGTPRLAPEVARITGHPERTVRRWLKSEAAEPPPAPAAETRAFDVTQFTLLERKQILVNLLVEPTIALAEKEEGYAILFPPASPLRDRRLLKLVARTLGLPFVRPSA